jgi:orotate phosphoribosyltransferase
MLPNLSSEAREAAEMTERAQELVKLLARIAYRKGDFVLSSGRHSDFYLDAKRVTYRPDAVELVGRAVLELIKPFGVTAVGGLTMGADAIVLSTVWASRATEAPLDGFIVRKEPKRHGLQKWIEGVLPAPGSRVAIVDDVVTSGDSVLSAVRAAGEEGLSAAVVVALVDREEGGAQRFASEDIPFRPVCTLKQVRAYARDAEMAELDVS